MTMRRRTLKLAKWTAFVLLVLSLAAWIVAAHCILGVRVSPSDHFVESGEDHLGYAHFIVVGSGELSFVHDPIWDYQVFSFEWRGKGAWLRGKWEAISVDSQFYWVSVPAWSPLLATTVATAVLFIIDRRRRIAPGHCRKCGYDLRGAVSDRCSECGTMITSGAAR